MFESMMPLYDLFAPVGASSGVPTMVKAEDVLRRKETKRPAHVKKILRQFF